MPPSSASDFGPHRALFVQQWKEQGGIVLVLEENNDDSSSSSWTMHIATADTFYATSTITSSTFPRGCSTIDDLHALLNKTSGDTNATGEMEHTWIDIDTKSNKCTIRQRLPDGMLRVLWKVDLSKCESPSTFPLLWLIVQNTLRLQTTAVSDKQQIADQITVTDNWKRTAQQLEGQWSKEKAILLHNVQVLLSEKHKHYEGKVANLEAQVANLEAQVTDATARSHRPAPPMTPDAPDDADQHMYDEDLVNRLAAGERVEQPASKKAPPPKAKPKTSGGAGKKPAQKKKKALVGTRSVAATRKKAPPSQATAIPDATPKQPPLDEPKPMEIDDPKPQPIKKVPSWMEDSDDSDKTVALTSSSSVKARASTRKGKFDDSSSDEDFLKRRVPKGRQDLNGKDEGKTEEEVEKLNAPRGDKKRENSGDLSDSSTEMDILKQLEALQK